MALSMSEPQRLCAFVAAFENAEDVTAFISVASVIIILRRMLGNDSQELPSQGNDNEFLPNHSHSYESLIQEHQQRRSMILNDQLVLPSALNSQRSHSSNDPNLQSNIEPVLHAESGSAHEEFGEEGMEEEGENQFLINQNSLAASIKEAMRSKQSQIPSNLSQNHDFLHPPHSLQDPLSSHSNNPMPSNSIENSHSQQEQEEEHDFSNISGNLNVMDSNLQSKKQSEPLQLHAEVSRNSVESDPFQNANPSQSQFSNPMNQSFPQQSTLKNNQRPVSAAEESEEQHSKQDSINNQSQNFLANQSFSKQQNESKSQQMPKSRSQIEGLQSGLDPESESKKSSRNEEQKQASEPESENANENSLSKLMKYNYFQKAYHQFSQKVESEEIPSSNNQLESDVKVFRQQPKIQQFDPSQKSAQYQSQQQSKKSEQKAQGPSSGEIDHILMTYDSKSNIHSALKPQEDSIIDRIDQLHEDPLIEQQQHSEGSSHQYFGYESKNERISLDDLDRISREHSEQVRQLDLNRSQPSHSPSQHSQEYFNQFNQDGNFSQEVREVQAKNNQNLHEKTQREESEDFEDHAANKVEQAEKSQKSAKESQLSHKPESIMPSIDHSQRQFHSKIEDYDLRSSKSHKKQSSMLEKASKNSSDLHLPQIEIKNKRNSEISNKLSNISKKAPSIKMESESKSNMRESRKETQSKKNYSKIETREKMISYSEGIPVQGIEQRSQIYRDIQLGSTTLDSKSTIMKKKQDSAREIFNTVPEQINFFNQSPIPEEKRVANYPKITSPIIENIVKEKQASIRSPAKERQDQIERIRVLKQAQRKRLQRQLQKVKKELDEINTRQRNMERIFEEKQKIQIKERERGSSRENDFSNKLTRHHRENEALLNIIKEHRKSKETPEQNAEAFEENINKNLMQLNQIRQQAEEKMREKKRLDIIDRMKKNEMRRLNEQKLVKANNQYIQQFRSVENAALSPQPTAKKHSRDKYPTKKNQKDPINANKISKYFLHDKRKANHNAYQEKLD